MPTTSTVFVLSSSHRQQRQQHRLLRCSSFILLVSSPAFLPAMISSILIGLAAVLFGTSTMALPASDADYGLGVRQSSCTNPERRDVAILPQSGYIAMAFQLDNPGAWIMHCHIAWHASSGLSMQFVESPDNILTSGAIGGWDTDDQNGGSTCANWNSFIPNMPFEQDDSGI
ncbi:multicopper oxidase-domain-containing protein [Pestalotiopsis sp. NC0098]|nr:multicopper oxidase-domain-containing protein [Pestalotiopsis sp. NC0098]